MPDTEEDPAADTQMFRAFVERGDKQRRARGPLLVGVCALALVVVAVIVVLQLG